MFVKQYVGTSICARMNDVSYGSYYPVSEENAAVKKIGH